MSPEETDLGKPAAPTRRCSSAPGHTRREHLTKVKESEVMQLHGMGRMRSWPGSPPPSRPPPRPTDHRPNKGHRPLWVRTAHGAHHNTSMRVSGSLPLCDPAFPQVGPDRGGEVRRSDAGAFGAESLCGMPRSQGCPELLILGVPDCLRWPMPAHSNGTGGGLWA